MKLKTLNFTFLTFFIFISCQSERPKGMIVEYKKEILNTEKAFAQMVKDSGLKKAFTKYAAEDAVLKRGADLIKGKKAIEAYYNNYKYPDALI
jgi:hypothetical protein